MKTITMFLMLAMVTTGVLAAQVADTSVDPFGFHRGMTRKAIIDLVGAAAIDTKQSVGDTLTLNTAPHPHPAFDEYILVIPPSEGLLKIIAVGSTIDTNVYGDQIKDLFKTLCDALTGKYGAASMLDGLKTGSIWNEPNEWTVGMLKKERNLAATWNWSNGNKDDGIALTTTVLSQERAYVDVIYEFTGWVKYSQSIAAKKNDAF